VRGKLRRNALPVIPVSPLETQQSSYVEGVLPHVRATALENLVIALTSSQQVAAARYRNALPTSGQAWRACRYFPKLAQNRHQKHHHVVCGRLLRRSALLGANHFGVLFQNERA
jgi:hypothetical protein